MSGWGAGLNGLLAGINNGMVLGTQIRRGIDDYKIAQVREQGIAEAKALQAKATPQVQDNGDMQNLTANPQMSRDPNAQQDTMGALGVIPSLAQQQQQATPQPTEFARSIPPEEVPLSSMPQSSVNPGYQPEAPAFSQGVPNLSRKRFSAGDKQFDTKDEADAYAKSQAPDLETFYAKTLVPRMKEQLIGMGRTEEAAKWEKYAEESTTKQHMKTWAKAFQYAQKGDYENSATQLMKLYPDYDDGFELVSSKKDIGPNGEEGFTMKVRDADGSESEVFHDAKTITEVGLSQLSPIEMFQQRIKRQTAAETLAAREAIDRRNDERTFKSRAELEGTKEIGRNTRQETKIEADEKREDRRDQRQERKEDRTDQRQDKALAARVEADARKLKAAITKADSPDKVRAKALNIASRDPMFATMSQEEKEDYTNGMVNYIQSGSSDGEAPAKSGATASNPFDGGAKPKGVPVFRNGKIEYQTR